MATFGWFYLFFTEFKNGPNGQNPTLLLRGLSSALPAALLRRLCWRSKTCANAPSMDEDITTLLQRPQSLSFPFSLRTLDAPAPLATYPGVWCQGWPHTFPPRDCGGSRAQKMPVCLAAPRTILPFGLCLRAGVEPAPRRPASGLPRARSALIRCAFAPVNVPVPVPSDVERLLAEQRLVLEAALDLGGSAPGSGSRGAGARAHSRDKHPARTTSLHGATRPAGVSGGLPAMLLAHARSGGGSSGGGGSSSSSSGGGGGYLRVGARGRDGAGPAAAPRARKDGARPSERRAAPQGRGQTAGVDSTRHCHCDGGDGGDGGDSDGGGSWSLDGGGSGPGPFWPVPSAQSMMPHEAGDQRAATAGYDHVTAPPTGTGTHASHTHTFTDARTAPARSATADVRPASATASAHAGSGSSAHGGAVGVLRGWIFDRLASLSGTAPGAQDSSASPALPPEQEAERVLEAVTSQCARARQLREHDAGPCPCPRMFSSSPAATLAQHATCLCSLLPLPSPPRPRACSSSVPPTGGRLRPSELWRRCGLPQAWCVCAAAANRCCGRLPPQQPPGCAAPPATETEAAAAAAAAAATATATGAQQRRREAPSPGKSAPKAGAEHRRSRRSAPAHSTAPTRAQHAAVALFGWRWRHRHTPGCGHGARRGCRRGAGVGPRQPRGCAWPPPPAAATTPRAPHGHAQFQFQFQPQLQLQLQLRVRRGPFLPAGRGAKARRQGPGEAPAPPVPRPCGPGSGRPSYAPRARPRHTHGRPEQGWGQPNNHVE